MTAHLSIGTQGWSYPDWVGPFYPEGTPSSRYLTLYAKVFRAVEIDSTFYAVPPASNFLGWYQRTPEDFRFAIKLPGELTHERRLSGGYEVLDTFTRRALLLEEKLGVILIQLPPDFTPRERPAFERFVERLSTKVRFAVEFRHPDWLSDDVLDFLSGAGVANALSDGPWIPRQRALEAAMQPTADFAYFRWQGADPHQRDHTRIREDRADEIRGWADVLRVLSGQVREIFGFFNNHYEGHSPASARTLLGRLGQPAPDPDQLNPQLSLF